MPIAQWIEQWFSKPKVLGSSPGGCRGGVEKWLSRQAHNLKFRWFEPNLHRMYGLSVFYV